MTGQVIVWTRARRNGWSTSDLAWPSECVFARRPCASDLALLHAWPSDESYVVNDLPWSCVLSFSRPCPAALFVPHTRRVPPTGRGARIPRARTTPPRMHARPPQRGPPRKRTRTARGRPSVGRSAGGYARGPPKRGRPAAYSHRSRAETHGGAAGSRAETHRGGGAQPHREAPRGRTVRSHQRSGYDSKRNGGRG